MDVIELIKKECLRRGYSIRTIKTYCFCVKRFLKRCHKEPKRITKKDIQDFIDLLIDKKLSGNTVNIHINSLKFLFQEILHKRLLFRIKHSKVPKQLPTVLTKDETIRLIEAVENPKHRLMVELMYSSGLRLGELLNLKVRDIEFSMDYGWIRKGKGNKDRAFILAKSLKRRLKQHISENRLSYASFIFFGRNGALSQRTVQAIVKKAARKAGIKKNVHPHTLRHSFATHLIENRYARETVQILLGHQSLDTTKMYIHIASPTILNVDSPLDTLNRAKSTIPCWDSLD